MEEGWMNWTVIPEGGRNRCIWDQTTVCSPPAQHTSLLQPPLISDPGEV